MAGRTELFGICERALRDVGYELVDLDYGRDGSNWMLRVFIDHPFIREDETDDPKERRRINVGDCTQATRHLSAVLDVEDPIPGRYRLEVSSPGINRRVRKEADFARFVGYGVTVKMNRLIDGRRTFKGVLKQVSEGKIAVDMEGTTVVLPLNELKKANLSDEY